MRFPKPTFCLACLVAAVFVTARNAPADKSNPTGDEVRAAVRAVLDAQTAAWNKGDLEGFMAGYWKSPELTFFSGKDVQRGWQATIDRYRKRYQGEGREMGKVAFHDVRVDPVGPEHAWVRGRWEVVTSKETLGGLFTLVFRKFPDGWRIIHDHTSG